MKKINTTDNKKYLIDHNNLDQFIITTIMPQEEYSSEHEFLEEFDSSDEAKARYIDLANNDKFLDQII